MKRVRAMVFEPRPSLPVSAACLVANGMREALGALIRKPVELRLFEAVAPTPQAWNAIVEDARMYRVDGPRGNGAIVLRSIDASLLARLAFGESEGDSCGLSALESTVLDRIVVAISQSLAPVCGVQADQLRPARVHGIEGFSTFFELQIERPLNARIGVALARTLAPESGPALVPEDLLDIQVELTVRTEGVLLPAGEVASLEPGAFVPITSRSGLTAVVTVAGRPIARGECGVRGNRLALALGLSPCPEGGSEPEP